MKWIGLTGGIASGKSEVAKILRQSGTHVIDADTFARQALNPGEEPYKQFLQAFGSDYLDGDKRVDRKKLGELVFGDEAHRKILEGIIHPYVRHKVKEERERLRSQGESWAVYDVPLLFENNMQEQFDSVVLVYSTVEEQLQRLMKRNGLTTEEARSRIQSQLPLPQKRNIADEVIENHGSLEDLKKAVLAWKKSTDAKYS